jgi:hypothetical protein
MSAAASRHELESHLRSSVDGDDSAQEAGVVNKLRSIPIRLGGPVIAVDLDDVLSQTNATIALCKFVALGVFIILLS